MNNQIPQEYTSSGTLVVSVYTASGAIPIENALVTVKGGSAESSGIVNVLFTDKSGNTQKITLPAPPSATSEVPGNSTPYAKYNIEVDKDGFYTRSFYNVPIFSGTTSIQPVNLIPLSEYENNPIIPNNVNTNESQNPDL